MRTGILALALALALAAPVARAGEKPAEKKSWLSDEMPLPLAVKTPQDLAFKQVAEREYLVFNLLASGKIAFDSGRFAEAADQWETLLTLPGLDRDIDRVVRPLAIDARKRAGQAPTIAAEPPPPPPPAPKEEPAKPKARDAFDVAGTISGGGEKGPGGAVVILRRADGKTPAPKAGGDYVVVQSTKQFTPHVLAVPVGASVSFRNDDPIFHNVFSLSNPNDFDLGLYKSGVAKPQVFTKPGAVQLFCNIHAQMNGWIVVVDSPWYTVADAQGRFSVRGVPAGEYDLEVWHESSTQSAKSRLKVEPGLAPVAVAVGADRRAPAFPPDKYGKQRQVQLGY